MKDEDEGHLRKVFHALDLDGSGEVTVEELQQVRMRSPRSVHLGAFTCTANGVVRLVAKAMVFP